ncbi:hypothetical protein [Algihabitans albus]|uniref:hypothetical protein n=1 Tax=Algihabitans albus TaxID=2164067 RepID=UPI000E5CA0D5|nr:hypothetical protein [Algihabitans albus]
MTLASMRGLLFQQVENATPPCAGFQILTLDRLISSERSLQPGRLSVPSPQRIGDSIYIFMLV